MTNQGRKNVSENMKKLWASKTPEERSAWGKKAARTRAANEELRRRQQQPPKKLKEVVDVRPDKNITITLADGSKIVASNVKCVRHGRSIIYQNENA